MNDGADDSDLIIPAQPEQLDEADVQSLDEASLNDGAVDAGALDDEDVALGAYSEDDDIVTQQVDAMLHEPRWLVQFTTLDRRLMDTSEVITALLDGVIQRDTPVWRGGMDDWLPVGRLDLLSPASLPTLPPQRRTIKPTTLAPISRARPLEITLAAVAIALSAATVTTSVLSVAGVFEPHGPSAPTRVHALRTEPDVAPVADEPERSLERDADGRPPAPDPERATAVVH